MTLKDLIDIEGIEDNLDSLRILVANIKEYGDLDNITDARVISYAKEMNSKMGLNLNNTYDIMEKLHGILDSDFHYKGLNK